MSGPDRSAEPASTPAPAPGPLPRAGSAPESGAPASRPRKNRRVFWTKQFYLWHWVSSALCLAGMLFFAFTGITLNHAADLPGKPQVTETKVQLPPELLAAVAPAENDSAARKAPLPEAVASWLSKPVKHRITGQLAEWSEFEIYLSLPIPGGDAWLTVDRETGTVNYEKTRRGAIAWMNDLHKGRHSGKAWSWFIDLFSAAAVIFSLTGLGLLWVHARRRPSTWPVVAAGILIPVLLILFFVH